ncbi:hypothetical protein NXF25_017413 [Crotalus adamanteus]|uniref:Reverse transcriptase n=1 Tax=Crotalus adamanteus TaxID=8729 RepID=A0AAW1AR05_CROAD
MVVAVTASLQGEAASWAADLFGEHATELADVGAFLEALRLRFEDSTRTQRAEAEIVTLRQGGRPVREFIKDFQRVAGRLRSWPEKLLVHHFRHGLDVELRQACLVRGVPSRLSDWYKAVTELYAGLQEIGPAAAVPHPAPSRQFANRPTQVGLPAQPVPAQPGISAQPMPPGAPRGTFRCFRCNKPGHRVAQCPISPGRGTTPGQSTLGARRQDITPVRGKEQLRALQDESSTPFKATPVVTVTSPEVVTEKYDQEDPEQDPMVSSPVVPFTIPICLTNCNSKHHITCQALIDSGCTRCLINRRVVDALGLRLVKLSRPISFEQVDGSLLGGEPASYVTELVSLEMQEHRELLRFIVIPSMTEDVILGLAWLDRWQPVIWWAGGYRRMRLVVGPRPPSIEEEGSQKQLPQNNSRVKERIRVAVEAGGGTRSFPVEYEDLKDVFSERECDELPPHRSTDCAIDIVPGARLPKPRMYPMSPKELEELRRYIDKNLERGFIQPARSRIAAPVIFQGKKDGGLRLCVDFRGLNAVSTENMYPLPLLKDMLSHLSQGRVFTKLDLREAYYRIRIKPGDEWKTAFNCPLGSFQFTVMPFGLKGAPAVFMQTINAVLHQHLYRGVLVYLDDILIYSKTMAEHIPLVREVLHKLLQAQLFVKLSKCEFHKTSIEYLGYKISAAGIEMDPGKVKAVLGWQAPRTRRQLQSFLGFANFYRQFVPHFAQVALPLTDMLRTRNSPARPRPGQQLAWSKESQAAFERLKALFAKEPILLHPDPEKQYIVQADASEVAVGAVLLQRNPEGKLQPCAYTSRKLSETERRWAIWEKEAFAIKWALATWRHFLEGAKYEIEIWTDHKNLAVLQSPRRLNPKHVRWAQYFQRFTFTLKYVPGGRNFLADALSRLPQYDSPREEVVQAIVPPYTQGAAKLRSRSDVQNLEAELRAAIPQDSWSQSHRDLLTQRDGLA